MGRHCPQQANVLPIVLVPWITVIQRIAPGHTELIVTPRGAKATGVNRVVVQTRGGLIRTGMGWL
jgi:hypothetical protein